MDLLWLLQACLPLDGLVFGYACKFIATHSTVLGMIINGFTFLSIRLSRGDAARRKYGKRRMNSVFIVTISSSKYPTHTHTIRCTRGKYAVGSQCSAAHTHTHILACHISPPENGEENDKININNIQNINFTSSLSGWPRARGMKPCTGTHIHTPGQRAISWRSSPFAFLFL